MKQRGRPSAASLSLVPTALEPLPRPRAPSELTTDEATVWDGIVAAESPDWFSASTRPILVQYCRHIIAARRVSTMIRDLESEIVQTKAVSETEKLPAALSAAKTFDRLLKMQERESRTIVSLGTKMRITQQSTTNHRGNRIDAKKPWEF